MKTTQRHTSQRNEMIFWTLLLVTQVIFAPLAFYQTAETMREMGIVLSWHSGWIVLFAIYTFSGLFAMVALMLIWFWPRYSFQLLSTFEQLKGIWQGGISMITTLVCIVLLAIIFHPFSGAILSGIWMRAALFWWISVLGMLAIKATKRDMAWPRALMASMIGATVVLQILSFFPQINNFPFALAWSESSYIYYASLVASRKLYSLQLPISIIYPSRALLDSLPFFLGDFPIWVHRLWGGLLWIVITATTSLLLAFRLKISDRLIRLLFIGWVFVYLIQGGVKYELQICVIIILAGVSARHPWRSLICILLASFWAGMSRLNWYPVPGILAIALYFLEEPIGDLSAAYHSLRKSIAWFLLGTGAAFLGSVFTLHITDSNWNTLFSFGTAPSFWYRLFLNPTYSLGVLPGIVLFSLPLWYLIVDFFHNSTSGWHPIRLVGLAGITITLFAGGLFVSTKIGGGGDLHNLDAYLVCLIILGGYLGFQRFIPDPPTHCNQNLSWVVVILALLIQPGFVIHSVRPFVRYDYNTTSQDLQLIESHVVPAASQGEVLFISQRQLLTFKYIEGVDLVPNYELVELAAMANLGDQPSLNKFYEDLKNHRFSMIVAYTQEEHLLGTGHAFGEENDVWVVRVTRPLLCEYEPLLTLQDINVQLLVPRQETNCLLTP